jgi:hypothetical protein
MFNIIKGFVFKTLIKVIILLRILTLTLNKVIIAIKKTS